MAWCLAVLSGLLLGYWLSGDSKIAWLCYALSLLSLVLLIWWRSAILPLVLVSGCFFGGGRALTVRSEINHQSLNLYNESAAVVDACVDSEVKFSGNKQKAVFAAKKIGEQTVRGRLLVTAEAYPVWLYGQCWRLSGWLRQPPLIDGWSYANFLAKDGIVSLLYYPQAELLPFEERIFLQTQLIAVRQKLAGLILLAMPEPQASLAAAMTLGYQEWLSDQDLAAFQKTGTIHIISISGLHIGVITAFLFYIFLYSGWRRQHSAMLAWPILIIYVSLIHSPPAAVRAALMSGLLSLALVRGSLTSLRRVWLLALTALALYNPWWLIADIGFQLSFLSMAALIFMTPTVYQWLLGQNAMTNQAWYKVLIASLAASWSIQLFTAPLTLYYFQQLSLIGWLANLIIAPLSSLAVVCLMLAWLLAFLGEAWMFWPAQLILSSMIAINDRLATWPLASITLPAWPIPLIILYYLLLGLWLWPRQTYPMTKL